MVNHLKIQAEAKVFLFFALFINLFFLNGWFLFIAMIIFYSIFYFLQQPFKPSVFTILFVYHFLQIIAGVWQATYLNNNINFRSGNMALATILSLIGLVVIFVPVIYYQNKIPAITLDTLKQHANRFSINKTYYAYIIAFFVTSSLNGIRFLLPGYTQIIISIVNLKWFFFVLFGLQSVLKNKRRKEFYFFIALEFLLGFYSFFSDFKTVFFFVAIIYFSLINYITLKRLLLVTFFLILGFIGATIWTTVKVEYRRFLNKGSASQNVEVSQNEALAKLYEITNSKSSKLSSSATENFLDRLQATFHMAKTMDRVPDVIPFQMGKNWGDALAYALTPRLFNPNKPILDASLKTSKYTGIQYASYRQGASFSLGYFTDSYIDFGSYGMFFELLAIGLLYGITYFYFIRKPSANYIFNFAVVNALYMRFFALDMDNVFFIGSLFTDLLTYFLLCLFFFPWLYKMLTVSKAE